MHHQPKHNQFRRKQLATPKTRLRRRLRLKLRPPSLHSPDWLSANSSLHNNLPRPQRPAFQQLRPTSQPILPLTFSRKLPFISSLYGFWSLTFYGPDQYLIPNPLNIFSVGDRSNITYDDGPLIYGPGSEAGKDRSFRNLVQRTDTVPPQNWTSD